MRKRNLIKENPLLAYVSYDYLWLLHVSPVDEEVFNAPPCMSLYSTPSSGCSGIVIKSSTISSLTRYSNRSLHDDSLWMVDNVIVRSSERGRIRRSMFNRFWDGGNSSGKASNRLGHSMRDMQLLYTRDNDRGSKSCREVPDKR
jgi:hypothetical protein